MATRRQVLQGITIIPFSSQVSAGGLSEDKQVDELVSKLVGALSDKHGGRWTARTGEDFILLQKTF